MVDVNFVDVFKPPFLNKLRNFSDRLSDAALIICFFTLKGLKLRTIQTEFDRY
jgi:hypothetical protein